MKSSSLRTFILAKHPGITSPREYRDMLIHEWILPEWIQVEHLEQYFVKKIDAPCLFDIIINGEIIVGGNSYSVIWLNGPARIRADGMALMSFRFCKHLKTGYVLIKRYTPAPSFSKEPLFLTER